MGKQIIVLYTCLAGVTFYENEEDYFKNHPAHDNPKYVFETIDYIFMLSGNSGLEIINETKKRMEK